MEEDKNLIINKRTFDISFYEMELEFNNSEVLEFLQKNSMVKDRMLTTYFEGSRVLENEKLPNLKNHICDHLYYFIKNVLNKEKYILLESWFQAYTKNSYHPLHIHGIEENKWSLIYYIQVSADSALTNIYSPGYPYIPENKKIIQPKKDKLVLFPSYFPHEVELNKDNDRIILSANFQVF